MIEYKIDILTARFLDRVSWETVRVHEHGAVSVLVLERPTGQVAISTERLRAAVRALAQEPASIGSNGFRWSARYRVRALGGPQLGGISSGAAVAVVRVLDSMAGGRAWRSAYPDLDAADAPMRGCVDPRPVVIENCPYGTVRGLELWGCTGFEADGRWSRVVLRPLRDHDQAPVLFDLETGLPKWTTDRSRRISSCPQHELVHNVPNILLTLGSLREIYKITASIVT